MLIAEALDERKKLRAELAELKSIPTTVAEDEDQETAKVAATETLERVEVILSRIQELTVAINRRNSDATLTWDGQDITVMEAIALRDRLVAEHRLYDDLLDSQDGLLRETSAWRYRNRRSKEDVKLLPVIERHALVLARDQAAKTVGALDVAVQKVNWTVEL